ncbi:hypothetical protein THASP1DRAFT_31130, partial [Thamnocephalis sphaerospora]
MRLSLLAAALLVCATYTADAQVTLRAKSRKRPPPVTTRPDLLGIKDAYVVELIAEPDTDAVTAQQAEFRQVLGQRNITFDERVSFSIAMNGISLETDSNNVDLIRNLTMVKRIWPLHTMTPPRVMAAQSNDGRLPFSHAMTGVDKLH